MIGPCAYCTLMQDDAVIRGGRADGGSHDQTAHFAESSANPAELGKSRPLHIGVAETEAKRAAHKLEEDPTTQRSSLRELHRRG